MAAGDPAAPLPLQGIVPHAYSSPPRILTEVGCRGDIPALRLASSVSFFQSELHGETKERKQKRKTCQVCSSTFPWALSSKEQALGRNGTVSHKKTPSQLLFLTP